MLCRNIEPASNCSQKAGSRWWWCCRAGRYDTRDHSIFRTLQTVHSQDFYSGCVPNAEKESGGEAAVGPQVCYVLMHFVLAKPDAVSFVCRPASAVA